MRKFSFIIISAILIIGTYSCEPDPINPGFEDMEQMTIWDYIKENEERFSSFARILEEGGIAKTMSAYNPDGIGYTLFLPDNAAIERFIDTNDQFSSLEDMLLDKAYVHAFSRYHAVNLAILSNDFPFGALPEYTLSFDFLTVNFVIETDTSYYKINNQAPVVYPNVELSNGIVHEISEALTPVTYTSYGWLKQHSGFSIFLSAVETTGLAESIDFNQKESEDMEGSFTMFVEPDSVYNRNNIYDLEDLIAIVSPDDADYTNPENPLYNYVAYHVLEENYFLDDFSGVSSNFSTFSEIPLHVNGTGLDITINKGKQIFDTIVVQ
ncbi:MAG: fasciclin domain-containing protein, partial [bacterium]